MSTVRRLSQDNRIKIRRAWLLLGWVAAERPCPCKQPACPAVGGDSELSKFFQQDGAPPHYSNHVPTALNTPFTGRWMDRQVWLNAFFCLRA
ncbi:hypothetical protein J6590_003808 [Homalodisca vitripennis]|nr:hypothetical protein J6590_003808 [Homalodisca vitripennis]